MQTVRFNRQAVGVLAVCLIFFLCVVSYYSTSSETTSSRPFLRDLNVRASYGSDQARLQNAEKIQKPEVEKSEEQLIRAEPVEQVKQIENDVKVPDQKVEEEKKVVVAPKVEKNIEELVGKRHYDDHSDDENDLRRQKVKEMMVHAWHGYKNYSWGANELKPVAKVPNNQNIFGGSQMPATIIDAADTLYMMDLMDEYKDARDHIEKNFSMSKSTSTLSVFETTIRMLGGLLSLFALTGESFYLEKAKEVGEALLPAFNTPSGIPKSNLDIQSKRASNYGWANGGQSILAEVGSLHIEFLYLSRATNSLIFEKKVRKVRDVLDKAEKPDGLYSNYISPDTGKFATGSHVSLGALGDSFYEYLIKSYVMSNHTDLQAQKMYWEASEAIQKHMIKTSKKSKLVYTVEMTHNQVQHKMGHLACFVPGMFALQAINEKTKEDKDKIMNLAEELAKTCHESYIRSETHIGPEMFYFNDFDEATSKHTENGYIQRPEVIEGWFYLWRLTGKKMYRDWVWDAVQAIDEYCRVDSGFTGLQNVYNPKQGRDDVQQSFFLAETLKYAYLTFADNSLISLDKWVFNTEAHPVPILDH